MAAVRARPLQMGMDLAHLATTRPFWRGQHFYGGVSDLSDPAQVAYWGNKLGATLDHARQVLAKPLPPPADHAQAMEDFGRRVVGTQAKMVSASNSLALHTVQDSPSLRGMTFPLVTDRSASGSREEYEKKARRQMMPQLHCCQSLTCLALCLTVRHFVTHACLCASTSYGCAPLHAQLECYLQKKDDLEVRQLPVLDKNHEMCWTAKNHAAAEIDAGRTGMAPMVNTLWCHDCVTKQYTHGQTPPSRCAGEQADLVLALAVDRFADFGTALEAQPLSKSAHAWPTSSECSPSEAPLSDCPTGTDGVVGRDQLQSAIERYHESHSDRVSVISLDNDRVYQRVFDSKLVHAGWFRGSREEELVALDSPAWPRALIVSSESSTVDPHGKHAVLRAPSANRQAFFGRLYGESEAPTYGADDSIVQRLGQTEGKEALQAALDRRPKRLVPRRPSTATTSAAPAPAAAAAPLPATQMGSSVLSTSSQAHPLSALAAPTAMSQTGPSRPPPMTSQPAPASGRRHTDSPPASASRPPLRAVPRGQKPIPSMTIPAERGGFAGRMAIRNHDRDVVDGTIADDDDACAKRQKLEEALHKTKEAKLLFDGPAQAAKGARHATPRPQRPPRLPTPSHSTRASATHPPAPPGPTHPRPMCAAHGEHTHTDPPFTFGARYLSIPAESKPTKFNVRTAFCPACCGTKLFSCGGDTKHYYYRCKICDPRQTGPTFKSPRPPPSYNK